MSIFTYFKKKQTLIGNQEIIDRVLPFLDEDLSLTELTEKVRNEANIEFASGRLDKIPTKNDINDLVKLLIVTQKK